MTDSKSKNIMDSEIEKRLQNPEWDNKIAARVNFRIKKGQKRNRIIAAVSPLAAAAIVIFAIFISPGQDASNDFENLIQTQLTGTYKDVFKEEYINTYTLNGNGSILYDNIDFLIDDTLDQR